MTTAIIGLLLGLVVGAGCRFFDIPSPAPPRLIGAGMLLAMTLGFVAAEHALPPAKLARNEFAVVSFLGKVAAGFEPW